MTRRAHLLIGLLVAGAACSRAADEPQASRQAPASEPSVVAQQPATAAQASAGKPLVYVWKSPT